MGKQWLNAFSVMVLLAGCGDDDTMAKDGGGTDAGVTVRDGGSRDAGESHFGSPCMRDGDCGRRLFCDPEVDLSFPADNLPPGERTVPSAAFPGGMCTPVPAAQYTGMGDSCDPTLPRASQGCGTDGVCVAVSSISNSRWLRAARIAIPQLRRTSAAVSATAAISSSRPAPKAASRMKSAGCSCSTTTAMGCRTPSPMTTPPRRHAIQIRSAACTKERAAE